MPSCKNCKYIKISGHYGPPTNWQNIDARCEHPDKRGYKSMKTYVFDFLYHLGEYPDSCPLLKEDSRTTQYIPEEEED
jgi:hypothetical protein